MGLARGEWPEEHDVLGLGQEVALARWAMSVRSTELAMGKSKSSSVLVAGT